MWEKPKKSIVALTLSAFFASLLFFSCMQKPIVIGFVGPLTGSSSTVGLSGRNGFLMAFGDGLSAAPGKKGNLKLVVKDDQSNPDECLRVFKELKNEGCSVIVLGTTSNAASKALPWAMDNGIFVISPTVSSIQITDTNLFVRVNTAAEEYGIALAHIAFERFNSRKIGIIGDDRNAAYVHPVRDSFAQEFKKLGGLISFSLSFDSKTEKPAVALTIKMRETACDSVLMIAASTDVVLMEKEIERCELKVQVYLPPWPLTLDLLQNGGKAVEGAVAISVADLEFRSAAGKNFEVAYLDEFGEHPSFTAMFGYEASSILRTALGAERKVDPVDLRQRIIKIGTFNGLQGKISFNINAEAEREMFRFIIKGGSFQRVE